MTQQARQFSWHLQDGVLGSIRFLIHDGDAKFAPGFDTVFLSEGIRVVRTPAQAPNANAYAERVVRSMREECLDRLRILNRAHLTFVLGHYVNDYNHRRPHQGLRQRLPGRAGGALPEPQVGGRVRAVPVLGGLHHAYRRAA